MNFNYVMRVFVAALLIATISGCRTQQDFNDIDSQLVTSNLTDGRQINANCVVSFFRPNVGNYFSRQNHQISLDSQAIVITANEPQGNYTWKVSGNDYKETSPGGITDATAVSVMNHAIVQAILISFTASTENHSQQAQLEKVKIEGRWYWPIQLASSGNLKTTVYKRLENNAIELVHIESNDTGSIIIGKPYNRRGIENINESVPTKIDILSADSIKSQPELILQVNYNSLASQ